MPALFNGTFPMHAIAMCVLMNIALVLSIAALIKYLIKGGCGCGCNCGCGNKKQESCSTEGTSCCK